MPEELIESLEKLIESLVSNLGNSLSQIDSSLFQVGSWLIVLIVTAIAAFLVITIIWGIRAHHRQVSAGREDLIGKTAEVKTFMNPKGTVLIQGELWTAILDGGQAEPGNEVVITKVDHLKVWVTTSKEVNR
ncbi:NfeD family protein [Chloroflexota bacterium]